MYSRSYVGFYQWRFCSPFLRQKIVLGKNNQLSFCDVSYCFRKFGFLKQVIFYLDAGLKSLANGHRRLMNMNIAFGILCY